MPFDAVYMSALRQELEPLLTGSRIDKINQPDKDMLIFGIRTQAGNKKLLISARPSSTRLHITTETAENPLSPPMFCMLLRKHLTGARITGLTQPGLERVLIMTLLAMDELGEYSEKKLIFEAIGKQANLILIGSDGRIIDSIRRVEGDICSGRPVLPGLFYRLPEPQRKVDITSITEEELIKLLPDADVSVEKWLLSTFAALPPLYCREIAYSICGDVDARMDSIDYRHEFVKRLHNALDYAAHGAKTPILLTDETGSPKDLCYMPIRQYTGLYESIQQDSFSALTEAFYRQRDSRERQTARAQNLRKTVSNHYDRTARRLANQRRELEDTFNREEYRQKGDLLMANLHLMKKGMSFVEVENLYELEGGPLRIALDPLLAPQQNAARYYKMYAKAKNAEKVLTEQIASGEQELNYLGSVLDEIQRAAGETELGEIKQELIDCGYIKKPRGKAEKLRKSKPMLFRSSTGFDISVGRNNTQNDQLTTKEAIKSDLWLHTQKIHGSHVIIHCNGEKPDDDTVTEAAILAAYYSQARDGHNVPVDYTQVKYVKKPGGARPGMVVYETYRTAYVTPREEIVERLRIK